MEIFWKETTHNILNEGLTYNDLFHGLYVCVWISKPVSAVSNYEHKKCQIINQ